MSTSVEETVISPSQALLATATGNVLVTYRGGRMEARITRALPREEAGEILSAHYSAQSGQQVKFKL